MKIALSYMKRPSLDPEKQRSGPWSRDEFLWRITTFNLFGYPISLLAPVFIVMAVLILGPPLIGLFQLRNFSEEQVIVWTGIGLTASLFFVVIMDTLWIIRLAPGVRKAIWSGAILSILGTGAAVYGARFFPEKYKQPPSSPPSTHSPR